MADFEDGFTGADNTELTSHTPDVGTGWTREVGSGTVNLQINDVNQLQAKNVSDKDVVVGDDMSGADMQVWAFFPANGATAANTRMCARLDGAADSYAVGVSRDDPNFRATNRNSGSTGGLVNFGNPAVDTWVKLKCEGTTITIFQAQQTAEPTSPEQDTNWTQVHQQTVSVASSEVSHGFMCFGSDTTATVVDPFVDSYRASALAVDATGSPSDLIHEL